MKKILFVSLFSLFISCGKEDGFTKLKITTSVNGETVIEKTIEGNFTKTKIDEALGLIEITEPNNRVKVSYYEESTPNELKFLNIKFGDSKPSEWRKNKGHLLVIAPKKDSLGFFFQDQNSKAGNVRGTLLFTK